MHFAQALCRTSIKGCYNHALGFVSRSAIFRIGRFSGKLKEQEVCQVKYSWYKWSFVLLVLIALVFTGCLGGVSNYRITLQVTGEGTVDVDPERTLYEDGTTVNLKAQAGDNYQFAGWSGALSGAEPEETVIMNSNLVIEAIFTPLETDAHVTGIVVDGRGGPAVAGAEVRWAESYVTETDANGEFTLPIASGVTADAIITRSDGGRARIQGVHAQPGETLWFEVPTRQIFNPNWSQDPPIISVNIEPGQMLAGSVPVEVSSEDIFVMYAYFNGQQRFPVKDMIIEGDELAFTLDTTKEPNGPGYLRILAYDNNENASLLQIPVSVENATGGVALPAGVPWLIIESETFGENIQFYQHGAPERKPLDMGLDQWERSRPDMGELDPQAAPPDSMIRVFVEWGDVEGADGYKVYRSFNGMDYSLVGTVRQPELHDYSAQLAVGRRTWYKVVPYNRTGEGPAASRHITPLPSYTVDLLQPANGDVDVELFPTFVWDLDASHPFPEGTTFAHFLTIYDANWWFVFGVDPEDGSLNFPIINETEHKLEYSVLMPGNVYAWDIAYSYAWHVQTNDDLGYSLAWSDANFLRGSQAGEAIFTTTTD